MSKRVLDGEDVGCGEKQEQAANEVRKSESSASEDFAPRVSESNSGVSERSDRNGLVV